MIRQHIYIYIYIYIGECGGTDIGHILNVLKYVS